MSTPRRKKNNEFVQTFEFVPDTTKPGRVLSTAKIGELYMSRLIIDPGVVTGNYYHKKTKLMFYVSRGPILAVFENIKTKERKEMTLKPGERVVHVFPNVSFATKNISKEKVVVIFFSNKPLRAEDDTFPYPVLEK